MKIAICQLDILQGNLAENRMAALNLLEDAARSGADVAVLPEMWTSGYDFSRLTSHVEELDGTSAKLLAESAARLQMTVVGGSLPTRHPQGAQNTSLVFNASGQMIHRYSKVHLIGLMQEDQYLQSGSEAAVFHLGNTPAGVIICYDLRFPELTRKLALQGAQLLFVPAEWPIQRIDHWRTLLIARAIENQMYIVAANCTGHNEQDEFPGHSMVISPWGEVLLETGVEAGVYTAEFDLAAVAEVRAKMPVLKDRRPDIYAQ